MRAIWKGAISLGLVHIPVSLYPGSTSSTLDFDLLDKRDFAPVGYKRVNKRSGKEVATADIVKGYQHQKGEYVVVEGRYTGLYKPSGKTVDAQVCHVLRFRDGKLLSFQ